MTQVTPAIPASEIVSITPSVLSAAGTGLTLNNLCLTNDARVPIGQVLQFETADDVEDFFGGFTRMAAQGAVYFLGFDNSQIKPGRWLVSRMPDEAAGAWLRGGNISALTVAQLQALSGALSIVIDGTTYSGTVDLSGATSFSGAAQEIEDTLGIPGADAASFTGSISGTTLTVSAVASGTLAVGQLLAGTGVAASTRITALGTGTGGTGVYTVSPSQNMSSSAMTSTDPAVSYDSVSGGLYFASPLTGTGSTIAYATGALSGPLKLTSGSGATISQGAGAVTTLEAAYEHMSDVIDITQNWATFMTSYEPSAEVKEGLALWENSRSNRFMYILVDTDASDVGAGGPSAAWQAILDGEYAGVAGIYEDPDVDTTGSLIAAFLGGSVASVDYTQVQGRTTMKFRKQSGLQAQVTNATKAGYLRDYGLNYYGSWTTAADAFTFFANGVVTGDFAWIDSYVDQIWLNSELQLAMMTLLTSLRSIPYNRPGYAQVESAAADPIARALNAGVIQPGVTLSESQKAQINNSAGFRIDDIVQRRGWYFLVRDASAAVRAARGSPPCTLWYTDGQSIHTININSIAVQ